MPNTFAEAVSQTFSSASLHFVLGREDGSDDDFRLALHSLGFSVTI